MSDMGTGEMGTPTKTTKTSTAQEQPPSTAPMSYNEWAAAFQAYYSSGTTPLPPPGYFPSTVASGPQPHPYHMWGAQPLMPPYGTPPPYAAMYPHGGMYAPPSMPPGTHPYSPYGMATGNPNEAQGAAVSAGADAEGKSTEGKDRSPMKRSKGSLGSLGMLTGKGSEVGKGTGSMNGVFSQSGDSGSEGSTEGSEGNSQNGSQGVRKGSFDQVTSEAPLAHMATPYGSAHDVSHATGNHPVAAMPISIAGKHVVGAGPLTNLNIGMDYWSGAAAPGVMGSSRGKRGPAAVTTTAMVPSTNMMGPARDGELWLQDERELKRQRRKQSNRESARRSRLRKQAECEELAARVDTLTTENSTLRTELNRITEQCKKLSSENSSLLEQLQTRRTQQEETEGEAEKIDIKFAKAEKGSDVEEGGQLDNESLQRDIRVEDETPDLPGKSNMVREGGNLAVSVSTG